MATRTASKTTPRKPARKAASPAAAAAKPVKKATPEKKEAKAKKPAKAKIVRDSFSMPKDDYTVLQDLKARAARLGRPAKKSEVLRAGVQALAAMGDAAFLASVGGLPAAGASRGKA